ncbi:MAG: hypothetical protein U0936_04025 [Planctomycetaceae bacterium]
MSIGETEHNQGRERDFDPDLPVRTCCIRDRMAGGKNLHIAWCCGLLETCNCLLTFLGICGGTLRLARRRSRFAKYSFIASLMFLVIMIYPGLNVIWNAVTRMVG